jgi:hypothetical protein
MSAAIYGSSLAGNCWLVKNTKNVKKVQNNEAIYYDTYTIYRGYGNFSPHLTCLEASSSNSPNLHQYR